MTTGETPRLAIRDLAAGYRSRTVFEGLTLEVPPRGIFALMGPSGVGKSTFLRTLSRWNEVLPTFWVSGAVLLGDRDLLQEDVETVRGELPLLNQLARLDAGSVLDNLLADRPAPPLDRTAKRERAHRLLGRWGLWEELEPLLDEPAALVPIGVQRRSTLARLVAGPAAALLLDEPFRDLPDDEREAMVRLVSAIAAERAVIVSSHNQGLMRRIAARVALIAAGRLVEDAPVEQFFSQPSNELTVEYLRTGNCWPRAEPPGSGDWTLERPAGRPDPLAVPADHYDRPSTSPSPSPSPSPSTSTPPPAPPAPRPLRPETFHWVIPERLAGCQQPGLLRPEGREMEGLKQLGCEVLVNLRSERAPEPDLEERYGIESVYFPIEDMGVPDLADAVALCRRIDGWIEAGRPTVLHCKAGIGRTGTLLAATLVYRGATAAEAIDRVRSLFPAYIQSQAQLSFVDRFERHVRGARRAAAAVAP